jgi:hypothetical protein
VVPPLSPPSSAFSPPPEAGFCGAAVAGGAVFVGEAEEDGVLCVGVADEDGELCVGVPAGAEFWAGAVCPELVPEPADASCGEPVAELAGVADVPPGVAVPLE